MTDDSEVQGSLSTWMARPCSPSADRGRHRQAVLTNSDMSGSGRPSVGALSPAASPFSKVASCDERVCSSDENYDDDDDDDDDSDEEGWGMDDDEDADTVGGMIGRNMMAGTCQAQLMSTQSKFEMLQSSWRQQQVNSGFH